MDYVYWVLPGLLAGRPGPDEFPWDLRELRRAGFGAILSLHAGGIDPAEIGWHGFAHLLLPLPYPVPPSSEDTAIYRQRLPVALAFIGQHVDAGRPTLVHCHAGRDRTGVVLACYLCAALDLPPAEAVARLRAVKPSALTAPGYAELVYELALYPQK
jgi:predicted protein tyrosine phosphatase